MTTIKDASILTGLSADTLRYYERIGLIPAVTRNDGGIRDYSEADINWINFIKCMRNAGLTVETLIEYVALYRQGDKTSATRKKLLIEQKENLELKIAELQSTLAKLDWKIEHYDEIMANNVTLKW